MFELKVKFVCEEGDEMLVMDVMDHLEFALEEGTSVKIKSSSLIVHGCTCDQGRKHASRN